ncbi:hypothetical protein [Streptomyces sp. NPDC047000]|uniref:hypothetical protein n=1 Tax=Streptomyces sp. NPDC047000 TaxID=3155474 RepID=UPI0033EB8D75
MIAVVVAATSAHENAVGIALLDKVAADTDTVEKTLVDQGFKNAVVAHGQKAGIEVEIVEHNPAQTGFVPQAKRRVMERSPAWMMHTRRHARDYERLAQHSETLITCVTITLMTHRLARKATTPGWPRKPTHADG